MRRPLLIGSLALIAGFGCHAGPQPNVAKTEPPIARSDLSATRFIAEHNKRAVAITSLRATPSITMIGEDGGRKWGGRAEGRMAMARDKDFHLEIKGGFRKVADIGSNDQGFWFWVDDDKDQSIYVCDNRDIDSCQLGVTFQPDWIMEAMGFREFSDQEARTMKVKAGDVPGTLVLTQLRLDSKGQTYTKETTVDEQRGTIREHKLYSGAKKDLLAMASISEYGGVRLQDSPDLILIPKKFRLSWVKEKITLDVSMPSPQVNPAFTEEQQLALFSEPKIPGTTRRNLALMDPSNSASSRVYESKPIPKSGLRLGIEPATMNGESMSRRAIEPVPLTPDLPSTPAQPAGVVGAPIPSADPGAIQTSTATRWRSSGLGR